MPQGSVIGPIPFLIYINDLLDTAKSTVKLFADDTVIYNTVNNHQQLQDNLKVLEDWEQEWNMEFNPLKHIEFARKCHKGTINNYTLRDIIMPKEPSVKYLGIKLEGSLPWNENTFYISLKQTPLYL